MIEFREWVKNIHGIEITDTQAEVAQRILDGRDKNEASIRRMVREYAVDMAKEKDSNDTDNLVLQIRSMSVRSNLYKTLKRELSARGWWKNRPRGKPGSF